METLGFASLLLLAVAGPGQEAPLLTAADVVAMPSPPPQHTISYGEDPRQFGHLRLPDGPGPHPVVVLIHGGCWLAAYDIAHVGSLEQAIADAGYAVWSLEYRRVGDPGGGWPGTFLDVARGADHLRRLARDFPLDPSRVIAAGHSAGGQLALWLAVRPKLAAESELYVPDPLAVSGVLALAPAPDLEGLFDARVCGDVIGQLMGGSPAEVPGRYRDASPMQLAPIGVPQVLLVGSRDAAWASSGRAYYAAARAAGDRLVRLEEAPRSGHFELIVPASSTWPLVRDALTSLFAEREP